MRALDLGRFRRARVWIGDLPDATYLSMSTINRSVAACDQSEIGKRLVAVELFVPLGARSMYGLVGGCFDSDGKNRLTISVNTSSSSERLLTNSLASKVDEVRVGFPNEYVEAFYRGIDLAQSELSTVISGNFIINCGAHGMVGSCEAIYESLAVVLLKLCNIAIDDIHDSQLIALFPSKHSAA